MVKKIYDCENCDFKGVEKDLDECHCCHGEGQHDCGAECNTCNGVGSICPDCGSYLKKAKKEVK